MTIRRLRRLRRFQRERSRVGGRNIGRSSRIPAPVSCACFLFFCCLRNLCLLLIYSWRPTNEASHCLCCITFSNLSFPRGTKCHERSPSAQLRCEGIR